MRCLYCGKQLALLRRWTGGGEFCSEGHKQSYHEEYNRLALSRLLEAQSKPEDFRRAEPEPDHPADGIAIAGPAKKHTSRDSEQGWTTVNHPDRKRLRAPTAPAALPAAPPAKQAPGKPDFLVDKPHLQVPPGVEAPLIIASPLLRSPELSQPRLWCKLADLETVQPPSRAGLVELANTLAFSRPERWRTQAEPVFIPEPRETVRIDLALSPIVIHALALADLLPLEFNHAGPGKPEPELQPGYNFEFDCVFEKVPSLTTPAVDLEERGKEGGNVECENIAPEPERRLFELLPLHIRPAPVTNREPKLRFEQIPMRTFKVELPASSPLPLRPRVAAADPAKVSSGTSRGAVKLRLAKPERQAADAPNQPTVSHQGPVERPPLISDVDLPSFLKELDGTSSGKSVWGNVHRYLKNIVGCLLLAALGGGYSWHLSATKVPHLSSPGAELSGEADRAKPERQIFVYPASLLLQDYRVDFEAPLTNKGTGWVFRVADPRNYYGMRLESEQDGEGLRWKIRKYVEVEGEHILSETVRLARTTETGYCRITLEVQGSQFRTYVQGRLIDRWTDARFGRGGFGYYGGASEPFPIRSVRVAALDSASPSVDHRE